MITVDDGIRKLKLLDAKGKVWTQDMILQVDDKAVSLVDLESKVRLWVTGSFSEREKRRASRRAMYVSLRILISLLSLSPFSSCSFSEIRTLYIKVVFCVFFFFFPFFWQNELENFPLSTIQHCQAVMNACNYNSILALICKEPTQNKPDLHLFQCDEIKVR